VHLRYPASDFQPQEPPACRHCGHKEFHTSLRAGAVYGEEKLLPPRSGLVGGLDGLLEAGRLGGREGRAKGGEVREPRGHGVPQACGARAARPSRDKRPAASAASASGMPPGISSAITMSPATRFAVPEVPIARPPLPAGLEQGAYQGTRTPNP